MNGKPRRPAAAVARSLVAGLVLPLFATPAGAELAFGLRVGSMAIDAPTRDDPDNLALFLAYPLANRYVDLRFAVELGRSFSDGETRRGEDIEFESEALYLEARTTSSLFVSLRGGYLRDKVVRGSRSHRDDGFLVGGGLGFVAGRARFLLEYTDMAGDADFISLSLQF